LNTLDDEYLADVVGGAILGVSAVDAIVRERREHRESSESRKPFSVSPRVGGCQHALGITVSRDF
jgi:hypothetical protein